MDSAPPSTSHEGLEVVLAQVIQDFMRYMKQHGLSTSQIHALMYIYHAGECQVSDISAMGDTSAAAASQLVERLVGQGLVARGEDPQNRRVKILRLTQQGMALIRSSIPSNHFLAALMAPLTADQRRTVQAAFEILVQAVQQIQICNPTKDGVHAQDAQ